MGRKKRTSRNPKYVVANKRRPRRNPEGGILQTLVLPSLVGAGGLLAAQWVNQALVSQLLVGQDPRLSSLVTGVGVGALVVSFGEGLGLPPEVAEAAATGAGISGIMPWLPKMATESSLMPPQPMSGMGLMVDVSHYGAPYKGLFGLGAGPVDLPAVSTVTPTDLAFPAKNVAQVKEVKIPFANPKTERGYAGGIFARQLFSGVMA